MTAASGRRVLIVEDEMLVAMHLEDLIMEMGHHVVGPAGSFKEAMELAATKDIDFAILDMNLAGTLSFPVADILRGRGIRFIFATGYGAEGVADGYSDAPVLRKPYALKDLQAAVIYGLSIIVE